MNKIKGITEPKATVEISNPDTGQIKVVSVKQSQQLADDDLIWYNGNNFEFGDCIAIQEFFLKHKIKNANVRKVAKLVTVSVTTRVIVDSNLSEEEIMKTALPQLKRNLAIDGILDHLDKIVADTECPFEGSDDMNFCNLPGDNTDINGNLL